MKLKGLALGSGVLVLLALAAFGVNRWVGPSGEQGRVGQPLMAGVDISRATRIEIVGAESSLTLSTKDGVLWTIAEQQAFPVDTKKLKELILSLTTGKVAHEVTRRKETLAELGLLTPEENGGKAEKERTGKLLRILDKDGQPLFSLILGNDRRGGPTTSGGAYVRYPDAPVAYLVGKPIVTGLRSADWIDTVVLDEDADKVLRSVRVERQGKRPLVLNQDKPQGTWTLEGLPADQLNLDEVRRLTTQLAGLDIFVVQPGDADPKLMGRAKVGRVRFDFFDQRRFVAEVGEAKSDDNYRYLTLHAELPAGAQDAALREKVERFNQRFGGRLLGVYDWDGSRMLPALEELRVKPDQKQDSKQHK